MAAWIYDGKGVLFWMTQFATFAILILAANTAYADFPRLSSIIARDGFLPRQFANRGDRLVFSNGIIFLAVMAGLLIIVFEGNISALIPLYAFGVFTGFTLCQAGMVRAPLPAQGAELAVERRHQRRRRCHDRRRRPRRRGLEVHRGRVDPGRPDPDHGHRAADDRAGTTTGCTTAVHVPTDYRPPRHTHYVVVLVGCVNKGALNAISYARSLAPDRLIAVSVVGDAEEQEEVMKEWAEYNIPIELHTISSPYRELTRPVLSFLDELDAESPDDIITVVIPEFVTGWSSQFLHNQSALALKARLLYRPNTVVTSVPVLVD